MLKRLRLLNLVQVALVASLIQFCTSAPVGDLYSKFIDELISRNCSMPKQIHFPFNVSSNQPVDPLASYLKICQDTGKEKHKKEAIVLCSEVFAILKNISCSGEVPLSEINLELPNKICEGIKSLQIAPGENPSFLKLLTEPLLCDMLCEDEFEKACQILFWSYEVQKLIDSLKLEVVPNVANKNGQISNDLPDKFELPAKDSPKLQTDTSVGKFLLKPQDNSLLSKVADDTVDEKPVLNVAPAMTSNANTEEGPQQEPKKQSSPKPVTKKQNSPTIEGGTELTVPDENSVTKKDPLLETPTKTNRVETQTLDSKDRNSIHRVISDPDVGEPEGVDTAKASEVQINAEEESHKSNLDASNNLPISNNELKLDTDAPAEDLTKHQSVDKATSAKLEDPDQSKAITTVKNESPKDKSLSEAPARDSPTQEAETAQTDTKKQMVTAKEGEGTDAHSAQKAKNENEARPEGEVSVDTTDKKVTNKNIQPTLDSVSNPEPISASVASSVGTITLEKMDEDGEIPLPSDKDMSQYDGLENEGEDEEEYARPDYEGGLYDIKLRNKGASVDVPHKVITTKPVVVETSFNEYSPRGTFGRGSDDIQMIAAFPEQEDSHFFFYFLSIVLIVMAGYLIFHNKQKIIALIVEGRHERRRRSHGVGYKKLETK